MIRGPHVLWLTAIGLAAISLRATESYATRYQSLPSQDWLESRAPIAESSDVPPAADLARRIVEVAPLLAISDDSRPRVVTFGPPAYVQRTMPGVRDAARIELSTPGSSPGTPAPVTARLDVIVFNRGLRARSYAELFGRAMDIRDPESGSATARLSGPDEVDAVWTVAPRNGGGIATVNGARAAVDFTLQVTYARSGESGADLMDLSARAEALARQVSERYATLLEAELR